MSGLKADRVLDSIQVALARRHTNLGISSVVKDYEGGAVSKKLLGVVMSYVDYINRTVWHKSS